MTLGQFKEIARKYPEDPFWTARYFWRYFTLPCSWLCAMLRITADQVTLISLVVGLAGCLCYCWPTAWMFALGTFLIYGWWFLDHVDGELARYEIKHLKRAPSVAGPYLDLLVHRWVQPLYHICMGVGLVRLTSDWGYVLLGCLAGANFVGFARTQGESMVLRYVAAGQVKLDNLALRELLNLGAMVPTAAEGRARGVRRMVGVMKWLKLGLASPGCLVMLLGIVLVDGVVLAMRFPEKWELAWSASLVYLLLQGSMAVVQNIVGTWYVTSLLRRMP
jgi:phosphatidylglycerophosphate synthase